MTEPIEVIIPLVVPLLLILLGLTAGFIVETRHRRSLAEREKQTSDMVVTDLRSFPHARADHGAVTAFGSRPGSNSETPTLVVAEVVVATDYLKSLLAGLKKLLGGEIRSYLRLTERARREATLRVVEEARRRGYNAVGNIRLQAADIGGSTGKKGAAMVTLIASGTAYHASR